MDDKTTTPIGRLGVKDLYDSIRASIRTILLTGRGEVPFRPRFGLGAERLLGGGMAGIDLAYEVADQLSRYEKRIRVRQVTRRTLPAGRCEVTIRYGILSTGEEQTLIIT